VVGCLKKQLEFVEGMVRCRQEFDILAPLPEVAERGSNTLIVQGCCTACGLPIEDRTATMLVHLRPCQHTYHIACFAYACRTAAVCLGDCNTTLLDEWRKQTGKFAAYVEKQLVIS
jgi:hypothetical protein